MVDRAAVAVIVVGHAAAVVFGGGAAADESPLGKSGTIDCFANQGGSVAGCGVWQWEGASMAQSNR